MHSSKKFNTSAVQISHFSTRRGKNIRRLCKQTKTLSHECELKELKDSLIKDMIIIGTNNLRLQEKL